MCYNVHLRYGEMYAGWIYFCEFCLYILSLSLYIELFFFNDFDEFLSPLFFLRNGGIIFCFIYKEFLCPEFPLFIDDYLFYLEFRYGIKYFL